MSTVTVIIVNFNGGAYISRCVDSLIGQTYSSFEAIIVDNGSTDNSLELLKNLDRRFLLIALNRNAGFAAANNVAIERANTEWIATLNPDAFPREDWLEKLMEGAARHPRIAMFGSVQVQDRNPALLDGIGDVYSGFGIFWRGSYGQASSIIPSDGEIFTPCAAAALYRSSAIREVDGFDENFFCYCEDVDLGFRLRLRGHRCLLVRDAIVSHLGSESVGRYGDFAIYHGFRNRLWTLVKNYPAPFFFVVAPLNLVVTMALAFEKIRIGKASPALQGIRDAFRDMGRVWRQRRNIQAGRVVSLRSLYKSMCWSVIKLIRRNSDVRPSEE